MKKKVIVIQVNEYYYIVDPDAEIKQDDYVHNINTGEVYSKWLEIKPEEQKVIATTNSRLHKYGIPGISEQFIKEYVAAGPDCEVEMEIQEWNTVNNSEVSQKHLQKNRWKHVKSELPAPPFNDAEIHYYERPKLDSEGNLVLSIVKKEKTMAEQLREDIKNDPDKVKREWAEIEAMRLGGPTVESFINSQKGVSALTKALDMLGKDAVTAILASIADMPGPKIYTEDLAWTKLAEKSWGEEYEQEEQAIQKQIENEINRFIKSGETDPDIPLLSLMREVYEKGIIWARKNL